ncbi:hypothetical protein E4U52_001888 [Claviceps spartinae]|nr:hypothetical protein E4U52_001888 [Claviceps spartinae]
MAASKASPAVQAARDIWISKNRPQRSSKTRPLTIRKAAATYKTSTTAIFRHLKSMKLCGKPAQSIRSAGRPKNLYDSEEVAVMAYVMWARRRGHPVTCQLIEEAANVLRAKRKPPAPPVGHGWYRKFMTTYPQLENPQLKTPQPENPQPGNSQLENSQLESTRLESPQNGTPQLENSQLETSPQQGNP